MAQLETSPLDSLPCVMFTNTTMSGDAGRHVWVCEDAALAEQQADRLRHMPHIADVLIVDARILRR